MLGDLKSTLAAQVLVWPLISYNFGRISLISPLVNMLILWTVPLSTVLGAIFIPLSFVPFMGELFKNIMLLPLDFFVAITTFFSKAPFAAVDVSINGYELVIYYFFCLCVYHVYKKFNKNTLGIRSG
jgi:hypothetical protein